MRDVVMLSAKAVSGDDKTQNQSSLSRKSSRRWSKRVSAGAAHASSSSAQEERPHEHHAAIELLPVHVFEDLCRHLIRADRGSVIHLARAAPGLYVPAISALMRNVGRPVPMFRVKSDMVWRWFQMTDEDLHPWELYDWSLVCNPKNKLGHVGVLAAADDQAPTFFLIAGTWAERGFHGIGRRGRDLIRIPIDLVRAMDLYQVEGLYLPRHLVRFDPRGPAPVVQTECYLRMAHVESLQSLAITLSSLHHDTLRVLALNLPATLSTLVLIDIELSCRDVDFIPLLRPSLTTLRLAQVRGMRESDWTTTLTHFPDGLHTLELGPAHFIAAATLNALATALSKLDRLRDLTLHQYYNPRADRDAILHVVASIPRNVKRLHLSSSTHIVDALVSHMPQRLQHLELASTELQHDHLAHLAAAFPTTFQTLDLYDTLVWFRLDPGPSPVTDIKVLFMKQLAGTARHGFRARLAQQRAWVYVPSRTEV
ncbi:hypothetical protein AMAG_03006 [Allomyces macrogynus ATCC 38327]|uniref:F-box domain-containing protein n=1 Tax=Allomyces macrogynus (strain ATCC 38327) TaxID=578462 RepID=A0A0L0S4H3_ALLM3|nr:hypothetical protein AMAG_03006 [Allomyces macrogynus ATCC 38327]|eukprot:KNE57274.1 hypothetical protein AMAG_03006 [Allomyces macrogynus ATCC 38327]